MVIYVKSVVSLSKMVRFSIRTTVGKRRTKPISSQKDGGALIRAGALNGDNTVFFKSQGKLGSFDLAQVS